MRIAAGGLGVLAGEKEWSWPGRDADDGRRGLDGETIEHLEVVGGEIGAVVAIGVGWGSAAGHALLWLCVHVRSGVVGARYGGRMWEGGSGLMKLEGAKGA